MPTTPEQRLDWARRHLESLRTLADGYLARVRPSEDETVAAAGGVVSLLVTVDTEPPADLGLIAGDVIHNLRSALDNLIWELATPAARSRTSNRPAFPIKATLNDFNGTINGVLAGFNPRLVDAVRTVQPFVPPQAGGLPADGGRLLALLDDFWNDDKHRVPTVGLAIVGGSVPAGGFQGSMASLARLPGMRKEVRFIVQRSGAHATIDDLNRTHALLADEVVPRLRAAT